MFDVQSWTIDAGRLVSASVSSIEAMWKTIFSK